MNWVTVYLWFNAAAFVGYGVASVIMPSLPAGYAGFELGSTPGTVEIMAMYGGLQTGFGVLVGMGARDAAWRETALRSLAIVVGSLGLTRLLGVAMHGPDPYNASVVVYELVTAALAVFALRSSDAGETTS